MATWELLDREGHGTVGAGRSYRDCPVLFHLPGEAVEEQTEPSDCRAEFYNNICITNIEPGHGLVLPKGGVVTTERDGHMHTCTSSPGPCMSRVHHPGSPPISAATELAGLKGGLGRVLVSGVSQSSGTSSSAPEQSAGALRRPGLASCSTSI